MRFASGVLLAMGLTVLAAAPGYGVAAYSETSVQRSANHGDYRNHGPASETNHLTRSATLPMPKAPKVLPKGRQSQALRDGAGIRESQPARSVAVPRPGLVRNSRSDAFNSVRARTIAMPAVPLLRDVPHRGANAAVIGSTHSRTSTGSLDGASIKRRP